MKQNSVSYVRKQIAIRNTARAVNKIAGKTRGDIDLRQETIQLLLSQALMQLPMDNRL